MIRKVFGFVIAHVVWVSLVTIIIYAGMNQKPKVVELPPVEVVSYDCGVGKDEVPKQITWNALGSIFAKDFENAKLAKPGEIDTNEDVLAELRLHKELGFFEQWYMDELQGMFESFVINPTDPEVEHEAGGLYLCSMDMNFNPKYALHFAVVQFEKNPDDFLVESVKKMFQTTTYHVTFTVDLEGKVEIVKNESRVSSLN